VSAHARSRLRLGQALLVRTLPAHRRGAGSGHDLLAEQSVVGRHGGTEVRSHGGGQGGGNIEHRGAGGGAGSTFWPFVPSYLRAFVPLLRTPCQPGTRWRPAHLGCVEWAG